jgi:anti-anti-sigma factor
VQVAAKPQRRTCTAEYKRRILKEADACTTPGAVGALLRREGLYSSHLGVVEIAVAARQDQLSVEMRDYGESYDPSATPAPDLNTLPESGLGVFIMRSFMDRVEYTPGAPNVLRLTKLVDKANGIPYQNDLQEALMTCSTNIDGGTITLNITRELDAVSVPDLRPVLDDLINKGHKKIVVDLKGLRLIDSSGGRAIVYLFRRVKGFGGSVVVRGTSEQPLGVLRLLKLDQIFPDSAHA